MQPERPLVSIIVRTKDRAELLKRAVQSIAAQTYRPIEAVVVNDGGCDLDAHELQNILGDVSLRYIGLEENRGRAGAGNAGIESSQGRYVGFLDDDDEFYPDHLSLLVEYLEQGELKVAYTDSLMVNREPDMYSGENRQGESELVYSRDFDYDLLLFENYIPFMCLLFDRDVLISSGGLDRDFEIYEDYDLLIRLGEQYPFHHIKKITAEYHLWSSSSQISQRNDVIHFQKESYLRLFAKHIGKFSPERIYHYTSDKFMEIADKDAGLKNLEKLVSDKDAHIRNLYDVIKGKDHYLASISGQIRDLESLVHEKDQVLSEIYSSRGWKALTAYYRLRDRILPPGSLGRRAFSRAFEVLRSFAASPKPKKKETTDGRLMHQVETDLSEPFVVGAGNALYLRGWCYHTEKRIRRMSVIADGIEYPVSNFSFARNDIFREHFQKTDRRGNSLFSGFWLVIPFPPVDDEREVPLELRVSLEDGETCDESLDGLKLVPSVVKNTLHNGAVSQSDEKPLIAICMTTYNPLTGHFRKQINSILKQTYTNWLCVISDDCSDPDTFREISEIVSGDGRFHLRRNTANLGFYLNFEKCLTFVPEDASFIAMADQDDEWHADKLSSLMSCFDADTTLVYSDMNIVSETGNLIHNTYWTTRKNNHTEIDLLMFANTVTGASSLFRRELLRYLLPFPEKIGDAYHDHFIAAVALALGTIKYVDRPLYDYCQHAENVIGHYVIQDRPAGEKIREFSGKLLPGRFFSTMRTAFEHNQAVYYNHYPRRVLMASVLALRCGAMSSEKRRIIEAFRNLEASSAWLLSEVGKNRLRRNGAITLGIDSLLLRSVLLMRLMNAYYRLRRILPGFSERVREE